MGVNMHRFFGKGKSKEWIEMNIDKLFFESESDRYFLILKAACKHQDQIVSLTIGNLFEESILYNLTVKNDNTRQLFNKIGIKIKRLRILKKINANDSAECVLKIGFMNKKIFISTVEAVRMALEHNHMIEVPKEMVKTNQIDLSEYMMQTKMQNNLFATKFIERSYLNSNEVIM